MLIGYKNGYVLYLSHFGLHMFHNMIYDSLINGGDKLKKIIDILKIFFSNFQYYLSIINVWVLLK